MLETLKCKGLVVKLLEFLVIGQFYLFKEHLCDGVASSGSFIDYREAFITLGLL